MKLSKKLSRGIITVMTLMGIMIVPQAAQAQTIPNFSSSVPQLNVPTPQELVKQYVPQQYHQYVPQQYRPQSSAPNPQSTVQGHSKQEIINNTNKYRSMHGLPPVKNRPELDNIAQDWANHLAQTQDLQHRPQHWNSYPSYIPAGGENILQAWDDYSDAQLTKLWYDSPGHKKIMLDPKAKTVGIGIAETSEGKLYAVQNYGR